MYPFDKLFLNILVYDNNTNNSKTHNGSSKLLKKRKCIKVRSKQKITKNPPVKLTEVECLQKVENTTTKTGLISGVKHYS